MAGESEKSLPLAKKIENDLQLQAIKKLMEALEIEKRNLSKQVSKRNKESGDLVSFKESFKQYEQNVAFIESKIQILDEADKSEILFRLKTHSPFLKNAQRYRDEINENEAAKKVFLSSTPVKKEVSAEFKVTISESERTTSESSSPIYVSRSDSNITFGSDKQQSIEEQIQAVHQMKDKHKKSVLAIQLLFEIYFKGKDNTAINRYVTDLLPIAFPNRFAIQKDGALTVIGVQKEAVVAALGVSRGKLDHSKFNFKQLDALKTNLPQEKELWSLLKCMKGIDKHFRVNDKVDACIEVLEALSQKKLISPSKFEYAMDVLSYACDIAQQANEQSALSKLRALLLKAQDSDVKETLTLKKWLKDKSTNAIVPLALIQNWKEVEPYLQKERETIAAWRAEQDRVISGLSQTEAYKKDKLELKNKLYELYDSSTRCAISAYELRHIVQSRLTQVSDEESKYLKSYLTQLDDYLIRYEQLRKKYPIPAKQTMLEKAVKDFSVMLGSEEFLALIKARECLSRSYSDFNRFNEDHEHLLDMRMAFKENLPLEERSEFKISFYAIKFIQATAQSNLLHQDIKKYVHRLNQEAKSQKYLIPFEESVVENLSKNIAIVLDLGQSANQNQAADNAIIRAKVIYNQFLTYNNSRHAALKALLSIYQDVEFGGKNSNHYLNAYLQTLLPKAWPELFKVEDNQVVLADTPHTTKILQALGLPSIKPIEFNNRQFNPALLDELNILMPKNALLWKVLKSLKPVDLGFTFAEKTEACIDVAYHLRTGFTLKNEKIKSVLDVLSFAHRQAGEYKIQIRSDKVDLPINTLRIHIKDGVLFYCVKDGSFEIQEGQIKLSEIVPNRRKQDELIASISHDDTVLLESYLGRILDKTQKNGHTFDKRNAMAPLTNLAKSSMHILSTWIDRELVVKEVKGPQTYQTWLSSLNPLLGEKTAENVDFSLFSRVWKYMKTIFNKIIYDYFSSQKKDNDQSTPVVASVPEEASEMSSGRSILNQLGSQHSEKPSLEKNTPIHRKDKSVTPKLGSKSELEQTKNQTSKLIK